MISAVTLKILVAALKAVESEILAEALSGSEAATVHVDGEVAHRVKKILEDRGYTIEMDSEFKLEIKW